MSNLTTFWFDPAEGAEMTTTQLLDFLECAPLLREIELGSIPSLSDAPVERVVSLPHLGSLKISSDLTHSILLNHLRVPIGALVTLEFDFRRGGGSPILGRLPTSLDNLNNISRITSINLHFESGVGMRLKGPTGCLYLIGKWYGSAPADPQLHPIPLPCQTFQSLNRLPLSATERLTITQFEDPEDLETGASCVYQTLCLMKNLQSLTFTGHPHLSFILALNPKRNASKKVICPKLKELVVSIRERKDENPAEELFEMVEERALKGTRLSTLVFAYSPRITPEAFDFDFSRYVSDVRCRPDHILPAWDILPGETDDDGYDSNW